MSDDYDFHKNNLIQLATLSVGYLFLVWDFFTVREVLIEDWLFYVLTAIWIASLVWFIRSYLAARKLRATNSIETITQIVKQQERISKNSSKYRLQISLYITAVGFLFSTLSNDWVINGIPAIWLGYLFILLGTLGLLGVNIFIGGPLDKRKD
ncbi:hypothetical protein Rhal01_02194 [Rubritalea halochordaticola]|uniref:DUF3278 domain-containing protein n=1 Tax=Rubritalea halochordaticola TaxID=714537 RepID=A0ABP9UZZ3_9BACT